MIVLTGGAGFIGSAFLAKLNSQGLSDIIVVDELDTTEKWKNLVGKKFNDYLHKDQFLNLIQIGSLKGVTKVIHLGACSSTTETDSEYMMQNNFRYSKHVAEWAIAQGARFIYASSAATYGDGEQGFSDTIDDPSALAPLNVYALSKQVFDLWAIRTGAIDKMTGVKFFNVFGPNEYHKGNMSSVIYKAYHQIQEKGSIELFKSYRSDYGDGEQKRDFVYIKDCNDVLWWFFQNQVCGIFNLGTGTARSWNDLAKAVFAAIGVKENIKYIEMPENLRDKYQYFTEAEMNKLTSASCSHEFSTLENAVADYVTGYLAQGVGSSKSYL